MKTFKIANRTIGPESPVYVIAEIGINHNGNPDLAKDLIRLAKAAGVDAVKFQIINAERSYTRKSESYAIFKAVEFTPVQWREIINFTKASGLDYFATFVNPEDIQDFHELNFPAYKISSSNLTNFPLLKAVARQGKPVILSTGLSYLMEIHEAVDYLSAQGIRELAILQCVSLYPTPVEKVNLNVIKTLMQEFPDNPIGFSDHTQGVHCAIAAVAMGAKLIEKHFTMDVNLPGPDHFYSATFPEMQQLVQTIHQIEKVLGSYVKEPVGEEEVKRDVWRRTLVARSSIKAGSILTEELIGVKRSPQKGLDPKHYETVIGKRVVKDLLVDDPISFEVIQP